MMSHQAPPQPWYLTPENTAVNIQESIIVQTLVLRPLLQKVLENKELAGMVRNVTFKWEEYRATSPYLQNGVPRTTPHRIPLEGHIAPSEAFLSQCHQFLDESSLEWRPEWLEKLEAGSADAEACLLLLALPNLHSVLLDFDRMDGDEGFDENGMDFQHLFRHEMLQTMVRDPKGFSMISTPQTPSALQNLSKFVLEQPYDEPWTIKHSFPPCVHVDLSKVLGLFKLPKLQSLKLCQLGTSSESVLDEPSDSALFGTTELERVILTKSSLRSDELEYLLKFPRHLKHFHYHVVDMDEIFERHGEDKVEPESVLP
jgi:hypothetical protein